MWIQKIAYFAHVQYYIYDYIVGQKETKILLT